MITVTVRLNDPVGEILGTLRRPRSFGPDAVLTRLEVDGETYLVVGGDQETLYVRLVEPATSGP